MFTKPIDEITFEDVQSFCEQWAEGVRVEYKSELAEIKGKIPIIVSSFANFYGGTFFIGVKADKIKNEVIFPIQGIEAQSERLEKIDTRIDHLHQRYSRYQTEHADARIPEEQDDAFQRLQATDQSLLKWYNVRMKEEQQLMKLFLSLKTLEAKLSGIASLHATYTPQEW